MRMHCHLSAHIKICHSKKNCRAVAFLQSLDLDSSYHIDFHWEWEEANQKDHPWKLVSNVGKCPQLETPSKTCVKGMSRKFGSAEKFCPETGIFGPPDQILVPLKKVVVTTRVLQSHMKQLLFLATRLECSSTNQLQCTIAFRTKESLVFKWRSIDM